MLDLIRRAWMFVGRDDHLSSMETSSGSRKKTILYVDHTAALGGGEIALLNLLRALDKIRFTPIVVLSAEGPFADKLRADKIEVVIEPLDDAVLQTRKDSLGPKSLFNLRKLRMSLGYSLRIAKLAKKRRADLIHTNSLKSDIFGGIAGRLCGIPVVWHIRDNIAAPYLPARAATLFRFLTRVIPTHVVTNSQSTLKTIHFCQDQMSHVPSGVGKEPVRIDQCGDQRWHVVYCGCEAEQFAAIKSISVEKAPITLVGRIAQWKGQHVFIQAAAQVLQQYPDSQFQIVGAPLFGEEEYEKELHGIVESLGLGEKIKFLGFRSDIPDILSKSGIVVHASTIGEPFGQVVVEAMASARPVIATQGGALPEIVVDGETGLLVTMGDHDSMADAICKLLANPQRAELMGSAARRRVQERFTTAHAAARIEAIYSSIFDKPRTVITEPKSAMETNHF